VAIAGYLGSAATFDEAIADFALAYADRSVVDHAALRQAAADGRIAVREGV
jgi:2-keto-4-pentenoate hydratase